MNITKRNFLIGGIASILASKRCPAIVTKSLISSRESIFTTDTGSDIPDVPYVKEGLIAMWDSIGNVGWEENDPSSIIWKDLIGDVDLHLNDKCTWTDDGLQFNGKDSYAYADTPLGYWSNVKTLDVCLKIEAQPIRAGIVILGSEESRLSLLIGGYRLQGYKIPFYRRYETASAVLTLNHVARIDIYPYSAPWFIDGYPDEAHSNNNNWNTSYDVPGTYLGMNANGTEYFKGRIRSIRVYSRALREEEILGNYLVDKERFGF